MAKDRSVRKYPKLHKIVFVFSYFPPTLHCLLILWWFQIQDESIPDDEHFIEIEDTPGYQTAYSQLIFAGKPEHDPVGISTPSLIVFFF